MSIDINTITISGRLARKPSERTTNAGNPETKMVVANGAFNDHTNWINVVAYGKTALNCAKFLDKGREVIITGELRLSEYEKDGKKMWWTEVIARQVKFVGKSEGEPVGHRMSQDDDDDVPF